MKAAITLIAATAFSLSTACGNDAGVVAVEFERVNVALVPPVLAGGGLVVREDTKSRRSFARLPRNALVADGRLFAVRQGDRLVATLQISTLVPEVELSDPQRLSEVVKKLLPGVRQELNVGDVLVHQVADEDTVTYVWFGRQMFEVLHIKGSSVEPDAVLAEIIKFQTDSPAWKPLRVIEEDE